MTVRSRAALRAALAAALLCAAFVAAQAKLPPGAKPGPYAAWFNKQYSVQPLHAWCCDVSDGHYLTDDDWTMGAAGYRVRIHGAWFDVPAAAMRDPLGGPNPTGQAIVWYGPSEDSPGGIHIYCFAAGTET